MALIEKDREPSVRQLRWFGLLMLGFFALLGWLLGYGDAGPGAIAWSLWVIGVVVCLVYYLLRPARRLIYLAWMAIVYPIGWAVSHLVMLLTWYGVITPIGLLMHAVGYDPMQRRLESEADSYWVNATTSQQAERYFRQY